MKGLARKRGRDNEKHQARIDEAKRRWLFCSKTTIFVFFPPFFSPDCCNFSCLDVIIYVFSKTTENAKSTCIKLNWHVDFEKEAFSFPFYPVEVYLKLAKNSKDTRKWLFQLCRKWRQARRQRSDAWGRWCNAADGWERGNSVFSVKENDHKEHWFKVTKVHDEWKGLQHSA